MPRPCQASATAKASSARSRVSGMKHAWATTVSSGPAIATRPMPRSTSTRAARSSCGPAQEAKPARLRRQAAKEGGNAIDVSGAGRVQVDGGAVTQDDVAAVDGRPGRGGAWRFGPRGEHVVARAYVLIGARYIREEPHPVGGASPMDAGGVRPKVRRTPSERGHGPCARSARSRAWRSSTVASPRCASSTPCASSTRSVPIQYGSSPSTRSPSATRCSSATRTRRSRSTAATSTTTALERALRERARRCGVGRVGLRRRGARVRRAVRAARHRLRRARRGDHAVAWRQDRRQAARRGSRRAGGAVERRSRRDRRGGAPARRAHRLPAHDQGDGGGRRARHPPRRRARGAAGRVRRRAVRGRAGLRRRHACCSRSSWRRRATSRCRSSPTATAARGRSACATARTSAATRRSSRSRPARR